MLVLENFIHIDDMETGCETNQIDTSGLLLGTTAGTSMMQEKKKERHKHKNVVLIKGGVIFLSRGRSDIYHKLGILHDSLQWPIWEQGRSSGSDSTSFLRFICLLPITSPSALTRAKELKQTSDHYFHTKRHFHQLKSDRPKERAQKPVSTFSKMV